TDVQQISGRRKTRAAIGSCQERGRPSVERTFPDLGRNGIIPVRRSIEELAAVGQEVDRPVTLPLLHRRELAPSGSVRSQANDTCVGGEDKLISAQEETLVNLVRKSAR